MWGQANTLTPQEAAEGWLLLFDGNTLFGWTPEGKAEWRVEDGAIVGEGPESGALETNSVFADYIVRWEFRRGGDKRWHTYEIQASGTKFMRREDGKVMRRVKQEPGQKFPSRHISLHRDKNKRTEYRNIRLKPLGLKPIFNGKDLGGWRRVESAKPSKQPPEWSVRDGALHVEGGPGQVETESAWADFILQLEIRTNTSDPNRHPNSGVFFRGEPNGYWSGYEAQIRNEYKDGNREAPVDYGTGAIYRYHAARKVVSNDNEYFTMTVTAHGRHLATWVNGYPVADWTDPNPEGTNVRKKEAKLAAGTISLQAHDPTTDLDFRNIRIAELPK